MDNLRYWPEEEADRAMAEMVALKGPTDEAARVLAWKPGMTTEDADRLARFVIPFLRSNSAVLLRGAVLAIDGLAFRPNSPLGPPAREEALNAALEAAEHVMRLADPQTAYNYADLLGRIGSARAHETLWRMVGRRVGLGSALSALTRAGNADDLLRLGGVLASASAEGDDGEGLRYLPGQLVEAYGERAFPYLERALAASPYRAIKVECARELIKADRRAGLAFALAALQGTDRALSINLARFVRERYPEVGSADDAALIRFLQRRLE